MSRGKNFQDEWSHDYVDEEEQKSFRDYNSKYGFFHFWYHQPNVL